MVLAAFLDSLSSTTTCIYLGSSTFRLPLHVSRLSGSLPAAPCSGSVFQELQLHFPLLYWVWAKQVVFVLPTSPRLRGVAESHCVRVGGVDVQIFVAGAGNREVASCGGGECRCDIGIGV